MFSVNYRLIWVFILKIYILTEKEGESERYKSDAPRTTELIWLSCWQGEGVWDAGLPLAIPGEDGRSESSSSPLPSLSLLLLSLSILLLFTFSCHPPCLTPLLQGVSGCEVWSWLLKGWFSLHPSMRWSEMLVSMRIDLISLILNP